jgi:UrcA family protein
MSLTHITHRALSYRSSLGTAAALGLILATSVVSAAPVTEAVSEHVRVDTFNLSSDAGTRALLLKLSGAAERVCGVGESRDLARVVQSKACYRETLGNAVDSVRNERLTQLYRGKTQVS